MRLALSAFVTGFATLGLEITALRLLAPAFGSNLLVFSNVVGVVLAGLAAGALLGGRWADRRADPRRAGALLLAAGLFIVLLPLLARPFLEAARGALSSGSASPFFWSLAGVTLLVLPPTVLLGAVAPFLVRLRVRRVEEVGRVAGSLSGAGTAGSLLGTFVPTLATIPFLETTATLHLLGALLILGSALLLDRRALAALALPLVAALSSGRAVLEPGVLEERESPYQHVRVEERSGGARVLLVDEGLAVQSSFTPGVPARRQRRTTPSCFSTRRATGASARCSTSASPGARSSMPSGLEAGRRDHGRRARPGHPRGRPTPLRAPDPNLTAVEADARVFLAHARRRYDAIAVDVFRGPHVPFTCATREFFTLAKAHLDPGGALMMNVAVLTAHDRALSGLLNTVASVFTETLVWHPEDSHNSGPSSPAPPRASRGASRSTRCRTTWRNSGGRSSRRSVP